MSPADNFAGARGEAEAEAEAKEEAKADVWGEELRGGGGLNSHSVLFFCCRLIGD